MCRFKCSVCGREVSALNVWHRWENGEKVYYCPLCVRARIDCHTTNGFIIGV